MKRRKHSFEEERELLDSILMVLKQVRPWVEPKYYQTYITPINSKIRDRLALISSEFFMESDTVPQRFYNEYGDDDDKNPRY